ncbi:hypothetical protein ACFS32_25235 [Novosphingobium pokkalii]|uniref:hypothetical protein n=1 Tax=Novosphingobium pokkalii TaxID=1770194 RepID=UPI0036321EAA
MAESTAEEPENGVPPSRLTLGASAESDETLVTARSLSDDAVNAEIAIGTVCTFCARFCAVTTISWIPPCGCAAAPSAGGAASCASAWPGAMATSPAASAIRLERANDFGILHSLAICYRQGNYNPAPPPSWTIARKAWTIARAAPAMRQ